MDTQTETKQTDKATGYKEIMMKLEEVKTLLDEKLQANPESEECKLALESVNKALSELQPQESEDPTKDDVEGMMTNKGNSDYMNKFMDTNQE